MLLAFRQGNQFCGGFEADIDKHPGGVFVREGGENGGLLLSFFYRKKERRKEKCSLKKEFRALRVQFSRAELATKGRRPLETCHFRESGQSF